MDFTYTLDGTGWATATLTVPDGSVSMTAWYLHDSLRQLAEAVLQLCAGETETIVVFIDKPGVHQVVLKRDEQNVSLEVKWFDNWTSWKLTPKSEARSLLNATVPLVDLQRAVTEALAHVLDAFGLEGYKKKWIEHDFPLAEYERLRAS